MAAKTKFILGGLVIVAALGWLGFVGFQESKAYYITLDEYRSMSQDLKDKNLKIAGDVVEGSIHRTGSYMEFLIGSPKETLLVRYVGKEALPDTFQEGSKVLVEGSVASDGVFQARHIEAKCASKYEAEYEKRSSSGAN